MNSTSNDIKSPKNNNRSPKNNNKSPKNNNRFQKNNNKPLNQTWKEKNGTVDTMTSVATTTYVATTTPSSTNISLSQTNDLLCYVRTKLPVLRIWQSDIPDTFSEAFHDNNINRINLVLPTGQGKSVFVNAYIAWINKQSTGTTTCTSVMPFRATVVPLFNFLSKTFPEIKFGYGMRGNVVMSTDDNCTLETTGYWLERIMTQLKNKTLPSTNHIIMIDEAHDASWYTDLALRLVSWLQEKTKNQFKLIVASATLDVTHHSKSVSTTVTLSLPQASANVKIKFYDHRHLNFLNPGISNEFLKYISEVVINILDEFNEKGDILIIMPGQEEIESLIEILENNQRLSEILICPLYSQLTQEEINEAINSTIDGAQKIIVSTNIVENAITMPKLVHVIDPCLRKVIKIDKDGISQLDTVFAAKSNIEQAMGRVGRMNAVGYAHVLIPEEIFKQFKPYAENEVTRNPLYTQIIKLIKNNLPVNEIMKDVPRKRIKEDVNYLLENGVLELVNSEYVVTPIGSIISNIPLSIKASYFLALVLTSLEPNHWYNACVVAIWIDINTTLFYNPRKKRDQSNESYQMKKEELMEAVTPFLEQDCIGTLFNVWYGSIFLPPNQTFKEWCMSNGIFERVIRDMCNTLGHVIQSITSMNFDMVVPSDNNLREVLDGNIYDYITPLIPFLMVAFNDRIFKSSDGKKYTQVFGSSTYDFKMNNNLQHRKKQMVLSDFGSSSQTQYHYVMALSLRKVKNSNLVLMSKIVKMDIAILKNQLKITRNDSDT